MGHPEVDNQTPFAAQTLFVADEEGHPLLVPIVKATYDIMPRGALALSEEQLPVCFVAQHVGDPSESSYRFEPEVAFTKPSTDVVLVGHAHAPALGTVRMTVSLRVGVLNRTVRVTGDRVWVRRVLGRSPTDPEPFERIPLVYERAYGGWDRSHPDPERHTFHAGNPVGVGYRAQRARFEEGSALPNIESLEKPLKRYKGKSEPVGFGFVCPNWEPRNALAGTYDDAWMRTRMPLLPRDFDRHHFNAASPGLVAKGYLRGDEGVQIHGASPEGDLSFRLPGVKPPTCRADFKDWGSRELETNLDTVIFDLDERKLMLVWRTFTLLRDGPLDLRAIRFAAPGVELPVPRGLPANVVPLNLRGVA